MKESDFMIATIIVGIIFFSIIGFSGYKTIKYMKGNKCPGCTISCSSGNCRKYKDFS